MAKGFGDRVVLKAMQAIMPQDAGSSETPRLKIDSDTESQKTDLNAPTSSDFGDVSPYVMLRWHVERCEWCREHENDKPPAFGVPDKRHCPEYYEIVQEYSDYERDYISRGNP